jgi:hypothetical protein
VEQRVPFIGPRPFTETEAGLFFGRESELEALAAQVVSAQIVLLYAPSGSGKSSLINAGLTPVMRDDGFDVAQVRLNTIAQGNGQTRVDALNDAVRDSARRSSAGQPSLLILDQFEEIVVALAYAELRTLAQTMRDMMTQNPLARIVISFREEYLARIGALFNKTSSLSTGNFHLGRLSKSGTLEAFERSLESVGFHVDRNAQELFLERLTPPTRRTRSEVAFEPLYFQLLGTQLWSSIESRGPARAASNGDPPNDGHPVVTAADVRSLVNFDQAVEVFYNSTTSRVCAERRVSEKVTRDWIDRELVTADETRSMVRRQAGETEGLPTVVLDDLIQVGLLRTEPRGDDLWIELAHDQLVERVREFNRIWWTERVYTSLVDRDNRFSIAMDASRPDLQRWLTSRMSLWSTASALHESGIQFSRWSGRWLPFAHGPKKDIDRLSIRAFVLAGTLINSVISLYRSVTTPDAPWKVSAVEGLDPDTAKRKLQATSLNLGRTDQLLAALNLLVTLSWARLLARIIPGTGKVAAGQNRRRQVYLSILLSADAGLTLLRWAVRRGLIENCLTEDYPIPLPRTPDRATADVVRRCTSTDEAAAWSQENPVLLVLDWRRKGNGAEQFERFRNREVPFYDSALKVRGGVVAWCSRADVRRPGWRHAVSGLGFPGFGQRTYYMVERGNVVAWRTVKSYEYPPQISAGDPRAAVNPLQAEGREAEIGKRFGMILTALIASSEALPSVWREFGEQFGNSMIGRRRSRS